LAFKNENIKTKLKIWLLGKREICTFKSHSIYRLALGVVEKKYNLLKKTTSIIILLLTMNLNSVNACLCRWSGGLVKNVQENSLTIHGRVIKLKTFTEIYKNTVATSIEVEILTKLKGEEKRKYITVWGDRGADCRPYLSGMRVGSEWIFSLQKIENEEYAISICGEHFTPVKGNKTWGYILYNDKCSIEKPIIMTIDSLRLAIENPNEFIFPTKSCKEGELKYFIAADQLPKVAENVTIIEFLKEKLNIQKRLSKYDDMITIEIFVDKNGQVEKIDYAEDYFQTSKMKRKYGKKIINLLKESSPWVPGKHRNENIPMKLILEIRIEELL
jgi:hypothetical protein